MSSQTKISSKGRSRLKLTLCLLGGGLCVISMGLVILVYGTPYNPIWWLATAAILLAAFLLPGLLVYPIEWVIRGYLEDG